MQSISVFFDIEKYGDFWLKLADVNRGEGVCNAIYIFLWSSLGKV